MVTQDGTEDDSPSSATPVDDASDISPVDTSHPKASSLEDNDTTAVSSPMANGYHLPNGSAAIDNDGFRRQHERRPSAAANGRAGGHSRFSQQPDDNLRCCSIHVVFSPELAEVQPAKPTDYDC